MVVELAGDHFVGGLGNERGLLGREFPEVLIDQGTGFFKHAERADEFARLGVVPDVKMKEGAGGLGSVVSVAGNLNGSHAVGFLADFHEQANKSRACRFLGAERWQFCIKCRTHYHLGCSAVLRTEPRPLLRYP